MRLTLRLLQIVCCLSISSYCYSVIYTEDEIVSFRKNYKKGTHYQDIFFRGEIINSNHVCRCDNRFAIIKRYCKKLKEPFTILDLGAAQGYFCFRLTHEFRAKATAVDIDPPSIEKLKTLIAINQEMCDVSLVERKISIPYLQKLQDKHQYDVVIATNILHHIPGDKPTLLKICSKLGRLTFIELPDSMSLDAHAKKMGGKPVAKLFRRTNKTLPTTFYVFENK